MPLIYYKYYLYRMMYWNFIVYTFDLKGKEILKAGASQNLLNDIINGRNDPLYKILTSVDN